ncbi:MAG: BamA/TamA family outer membrane protein [Saprospiraceae bacterium]
MKPLLILFLLNCFLLTSGLAQSLSVSNVRFAGLKKTKATYLSRFIDSQINTNFTTEQADLDVQQLKNLLQVANARYTADTIDNRVQLTYHVDEAITLFPIVQFGGVEGNVWGRVGATDANWLGLGQQLTVYYQNSDGRSGGNIFYRIPHIGGSKWGTSFSLLRWASIEPLYFGEDEVRYLYDQTSIAGSAIYELERQHNIELGATYFIEDYAKAAEQALENPPGPDALRQPKLLFKLVHSISKINYHFFYRDGFDNVANAQTVYNIDDGNWFHIFINESRYFKRIKKRGNLAARFRFGISTNNNTPFAPFVLDSHVNIRGAGNRIDRGTAAVILNLEYRHTFWERERWAAQVIGFSDFGTWRNPGGNFGELSSRDNFRHFVGAGARLIFKKAHDAVIRFDYGVDVYDKNQRGIVIGLGQYF